MVKLNEQPTNTTIWRNKMNRIDPYRLTTVKSLNEMLAVIEVRGYTPEVTINFGKYKGQKLNHISKSYVQWAKRAVADETQRQAIEKSPELTCNICGGKIKEAELDSEAVIDIYSNDLNQDVLVYKCPKCKETAKSLRRG